MSDPHTRLIWGAAALIAIQVIHGAIPAETESDTVVGFYTGILLLVASITALVGLVRRSGWAPPLLGITGAVVAVGFLLYHALPIRGPLTNPYVGEDQIGLAQWAPVIVAMAIGAWCAWEAWRLRERDRQVAVT